MKKLNNFTTIIIFTVLTIVGIAFIPLQSVQLNPSDSKSVISVQYQWQNASGRIVEQQVTTPLEASFGTLSGISKITSTSSNGSGNIRIIFDKDIELNAARFHISTIIRQLYNQLPKGVSYPQIAVNNPSDDSNKPLLSYQLNASVLPPEIQQYAEENISPQLSAIKGVYKIDVYGANPYEWIVEYNKKQLEAFNSSASIIKQALKEYFGHQELGAVIDITSANDSIQHSIRLGNSRKEEPEWSAIPVGKSNNRIIYLTDVAKVSHIEREASMYYRINGLNSINVLIYPETGSNQLRLSETVVAKIEALEKDLPEGYTLTQSYNASAYISDELHKIAVRTVLTIVILLFFVFLINRKIGYLLIIVCSLLSNIAIAFLLYYILGVEIHLYSLAGITVSLGLIIDNSIVMADHLNRKSNKNVFLAILASTLTTIASLSIIYFLPEEQRFNLLDFAMVMIVNLTVSLFVALFFIPALSQLRITNHELRFKKRKLFSIFRRKRLLVRFNAWYGRLIYVLLRFRKSFIVLAILSFGLPVFWLPKTVENNKWYSQIYNQTLGNETYTESVRPIINKILGGSLRLFTNYVFESSFYATPEETKLYIRGRLPEGTTLKQTNEIFVRMEHYLRRYNGIKRFVTQISNGTYGYMTIHFKKEFEASGFPFVLQSDLIAYSINLDGVDWSISGVGEGYRNPKGSDMPNNFSTAIYGFNYDELNRQAEIMKEKLLKHPRVKKAEISGKQRFGIRSRYEYHLALDNSKIASQNSSPVYIYNDLKQVAGSDNYATHCYYNNNYEAVKLRTQASSNFNKWDLQHLAVAATQLGDMSHIEKTKAYGNIDKENQQYIRTVNFDYVGTEKFGNKHLDKVLAEMKAEMPLGYRTKKLQRNRWYSKEEGTSYSLLFLILLIIYFICAILFKSLRQPFAVIAMIPLSFIGVFLTFYLFDFNFDQGGYASFVLLCGITVNSALYIINELNNLRKHYANRNMPAIRLYIKAFNGKIIPVILTVLSTVMGLMPFLIGGQNEVFWFALAVGTIGGLLFSVIVIFLYLPLFFNS